MAKIETIDDIKKNFLNSALEEFDDSMKKALKYTNKKMEKEAQNMYKTFIRQFYLYKTKSYIRYGELRPGSCEGNNLYEGMDIYTKESWDKPALFLYEPDDPEYNSNMVEHYKFDKAEDVLWAVYRGIRYPYRPTFKGNRWIGNYKGKYFSYKGFMIDAFNKFNNEFDEIVRPVIIEGLRINGIIV